MNSNSALIEHPGQIVEINSQGVVVCFQSNPSCEGCKAKAACGFTDSNEKTLFIATSERDFFVGESVMILLRQSLGFRALFMGYVLPFMVVIIVLVATLSFGINEGVAGLISLFSLVPYYIGLFVLRGKISKQFTFHIQRL